MHREEPSVYSEDELRTYGKEVAARVEKYGDTEPKPDFTKIRKMSIQQRKQLPIRALGLQTRTINMLENCDVFYVWQLLERNSNFFLRLPNVGEKTILEIKIGLKNIGLKKLWC